MAIRHVAAAKGTRGARRYVVNASYPVGPAGGYTPGDLATAYDVNPDGGATQTVGIVDAYDDPIIASDLATFDSEYGLPPETASSFKTVGQSGTSLLPQPDTTGWSVEESLDVEAVRAICHLCKIILVETTTNLTTDLEAGVKTAVKLGATEVSNSYGGPENPSWTTSDRTAYEAHYSYPGVVVTASTGDDGWFGWDLANNGTPSRNAPDVPSSLPTVVAVGGTTLAVNTDGTRGSERVWNADGPADANGLFDGPQGATGGGCSTLFPAGGWQSHAPGYRATGCGTHRAAADVSADADPATGLDIVDTYNCGSACLPLGWFTIGGTSLSAPLIAAMWALAGGAGGVTYPALSLYGHLISPSPSMYDVTIGGNSWCDQDTTCASDTDTEVGTPNPNDLEDINNSKTMGQLDCAFTATGTLSADDAQCNATKGYDGPSGVGTPDGLQLFKPMRPTAKVHLPTTLTAKRAAKFTAISTDPFPGGKITKYSWNWGDKTTASTRSSPTHAYLKAGHYTLRLTETDNYGRTVSTTSKIVVRKARDEKQ